MIAELEDRCRELESELAYREADLFEARRQVAELRRRLDIADAAHELASNQRDSLFRQLADLRRQLAQSWVPVEDGETIELEDLPTESVQVVDGHIVASTFVGDEDDTFPWTVWLPDWLRLCRRQPQEPSS